MSRLSDVLLCAVLVATPALGADGWTEESVLQRLARSQPTRVAFREVKHSPFVTGPVVLQGHLEYRPPDYLSKEVAIPFNERYVVAGGRIEIWRDGTLWRSLGLDQHPVIAAFAAAFRATLGGDPAQLRTHFLIELQGDAGRWSMTLRPRDKEVERFVAAIRLTGHDDRIGEIEIRETGGEVSVMRLRADGF